MVPEDPVISGDAEVGVFAFVRACAARSGRVPGRLSGVRSDLRPAIVVMALSPSTAREKSGGGEMSRLRRQYQATE